METDCDVTRETPQTFEQLINQCRTVWMQRHSSAVRLSSNQTATYVSDTFYIAALFLNARLSTSDPPGQFETGPSVLIREVSMNSGSPLYRATQYFDTLNTQYDTSHITSHRKYHCLKAQKQCGHDTLNLEYPDSILTTNLCFLDEL